MTLATLDRPARRRPALRLQDRDPGIAVLVLILGLVAAARLAALALSPSELGFDEAQYWAWSRDLAFGYFTKPPLIAWAIALETEVCGQSAACVRSASPLLHFATGLCLAALARRLYGGAAGFWTGLFYTLMPGIAVSSFLMTTDVFLLFFWSLGLLALVSHLERPRLATALLFGASVGIGLYAKYAMIYLPILCALVAVALPETRPALLRRESLAALALALLVVSPNLAWNASHSFATFEHTGENIGWSLSRLNPGKGFEFLAVQFAVAGPVIFGAMLNALLLGARTEKPRTDALLLWLSWPVLLAITLQGFLSQANANWGATAYPAGTVLATALVLRHSGRFFFSANLLVCGAVSAAILVGTAVLDPARVPEPARQLRQLGGWETTARNLTALARERGATRLVIEGRALTAGLLHPLRDSGLDTRALLPDGARPSDQFELDRPWRPADGTAATLFAGLSREEAEALGLRPVGTIEAPIYSQRSGTMRLYGAP
ncbi:glycosyltransferase family 39 protein [Aurantimonas sp. Leaf443]|uniref:ArnT family glycosyltransferase n=1 Tax=Aurantimonas sp. Leaf443 TaxID=1736378 RepID=UPI0006F31069|nr:glycosyltransferase family 39 protein [Aurantimonas sp. Leaf443]KQT82202.1 hypothetical protein ASG48_16330 [Aurantimonas sp. Leaf443]